MRPAKQDPRQPPCQPAVVSNCLVGALVLWWRFGGRIVKIRTDDAWVPWHFLLRARDGLVYDFTVVRDEHGRGREWGLVFEGWVRVREPAFWEARGVSFN